MKTIKNNWYLFKTVIAICPVYFVLTMINCVFDGLGVSISSLIIKLIIDNIVTPDLNYIIKVLIVYLLYKILTTIYSNWLNLKYAPIAIHRYRKHMNNIFLNKCREIDIEKYETPDFYEKSIRAGAEIDKRGLEIANIYFSLFRAIISIVSVVSLIISINFFVIIYSVINVIVSLVLVFIKNKINFNFNEEKVTNNRKINYFKSLFFNYAPIKDIKLSNSHEFFIQKYNLHVDDEKDILNKYNKKSNYLNNIISIFQTILYAILLLYVSWCAINGQITIGDVSVIVTAAASLSSSLLSIFSCIPKLKENNYYIGYIKDFFEYKSKIESSHGTLEISTSKGLSLKIEHLYFSYPGNDRLVLNDINLDIKEGQITAIVGFNGAGKTTLLKIISQLYTYQKGNIYINGIPCEQYSVKSIQDHISYMASDFMTYSMSIRENLQYNSHNILSDEQMISALSDCDVDPLNNSNNPLQQQMSKLFYNDGIIMSGGETQKFIIAKTLLKNADLYILDEPNSALDPLSEQRLNCVLKNKLKGKTVIIVSHRLQTISFADHIVLMEKGKIIEQGTHQSLLDMDGSYKKMYIAQLGKRL